MNAIESFVNDKLSSKLWRLNNLYKIRDKNGDLITLRLNKSQMYVLTQFKHNRKIILKSRQQGITTMAVAYNLDSCLFKSGFSAGVQSYGLDESQKLQAKANLMWEELDPAIKKLLNIEIVMNNSRGMEFSNGSILKIGNFRGDTLQSLHVSELAKISKKFPDKANELKTGAFQAIGKNSKITIESTAEGKTGLFYEMWQKATLKSDKLHTFSFQPIFLSWMMDPDCNLYTEVEEPPEVKEYLDNLEKEYPLEPSQRWWYASKFDEIGWDIKQEYPSTPAEAFEKAIEGTYYEHEYKKLKVEPVQHDPNLLVHSAVDLGMNDTFSIIFFQQHSDKSVKIIGEYMDCGHGLKYYRDVFDALATKYRWTHGITYVPHDVAVRELIADKTRYQAMRELKFNPVIVKKHRIDDGIEATRQFLSKVVIDPKCEVVIAAIQNYRKDFNSKLGVFLDRPVHDEHSHPADALRYLAMGLKHRPPANIYTRKTYSVNTDLLEGSGYDV